MSGKVRVFGCGAQKAGTTTLFAYLCAHPALSAPSAKELHFFDDETVDWANPNYAALESRFGAAGAGARFEVTPIYGFWPPALARLKAYNPQARLVFLFRDPLDRAFSHWRMEVGRGADTLTFAEALRAEDARLAAAPPLSRPWRTHSYLRRGAYGEQVARALALFPREQLLFLRAEDVFGDPAASLARLAAFLDIPPFPETRPKWEFRGAHSGAGPTPEDRAFARTRLAADAGLFAELTQLDPGGWPTFA